MVRTKRLLIRSAFTMIELIFAIVVIAIAVVSLPIMLQTTSRGIESNIIQEAIFASSSILNQATTLHWDKYSLADYSSANIDAKVINTGDCNATTHKRIGHIYRKCLDNNTLTLFDGGTYNAALDYDQAIEEAAKFYNHTEIISGTNNAASYKNKYRASVDIKQCKTATSCVQFGLESPNPDLKEIEINVEDKNGNTLVLLRAYSANIGEITPKSEVY